MWEGKAALVKHPIEKRLQQDRAICKNFGAFGRGIFGVLGMLKKDEGEKNESGFPVMPGMTAFGMVLKQINEICGQGIA